MNLLLKQMDRLAKQFNEKYHINFQELEKIIFKSGHEPRFDSLIVGLTSTEVEPKNTIDYYYHPETKLIYSYYFFDGGKWDTVILYRAYIEYPKELCINLEEIAKLKEKVNLKSNDVLEIELKICKLELEKEKVKLNKLELEKEIIKLNIELEKLKQNK